jgi:hypothetical protein
MIISGQKAQGPDLAAARQRLPRLSRAILLRPILVGAALNDKERQAARLLLTGAVGFICAAEATHERHLARPHEPKFWPAISVNVCYVFELSLKAFLASRGATGAQLKAIGHDLKKGLAEARAAGYRPAHPAIEEIIDLLSPLHKSSALRYLEDKSVDLPETRNLIAIAHAHLRGIGEQIPISAIP